MSKHGACSDNLAEFDSIVNFNLILLPLLRLCLFISIILIIIDRYLLTGHSLKRSINESLKIVYVAEAEKPSNSSTLCHKFYKL